MPSTKSIGFAIALALPVIALFAGAYPLFHNRYIHPIGRICGEVSEGDSCADVEARMSEYESHGGTSEVQLLKTTTTRSVVVHAEIVEESPLLHLYDVNAFDDLQVSVRCDSDTGEVVEKFCILD